MISDNSLLSPPSPSDFNGCGRINNDDQAWCNNQNNISPLDYENYKDYEYEHNCCLRAASILHSSCLGVSINDNVGFSSWLDDCSGSNPKLKLY